MSEKKFDSYREGGGGEMTLKVITTNDMELFLKSDEFKEFQKQCDAYTEHVIKNAIDGLSESEKAEFFCWYLNQMPDDFWETRSEKSGFAIAYAISCGLG